jgi:hypothetical protein
MFGSVKIVTSYGISLTAKENVVGVLIGLIGFLIK